MLGCSRSAALRWATLATVLLAATACHSGVNYPHPAGPRFAAPVPARPSGAAPRDTLRFVTFNVEYALHVDSAVAVLLFEPDLVDADVVLLQEMDEVGVQRAADALGMGYVYYPAMLSRSTGRHFGNAVLSRWAIVSDEKLVLPHLAVFGQTQRIAVIATIQVGATRLRVYSVRLATVMDQAERDRRDQMRAILDDAGLHPYVVIGGDLNSQGLAAMAEERGFAWPTREGPWTAPVGRLDHIVFRGLVPPDSAASGTVEDNRGASDHRPVWAVGVIP